MIKRDTVIKNGNCPLFSINVMGEDNFHNLWQVMSEPLFWPTKPLHNPVFYYRFIISHTFHFPHLSHVVYRSSLIQFACIGVAPPRAAGERPKCRQNGSSLISVVSGGVIVQIVYLDWRTAVPGVRHWINVYLWVNIH